MEFGAANAGAELDVRGALAYWGAPLTGCVPTSAVPLEETLVLALELSHQDATVLRVLPTVLLKNRSRVNVPLLLTLARQKSVSAELGLVADLAWNLRGVRVLSEDQMPQKPSGPPQPYANLGGGPRMRAIVAERTPLVARSWGFLMAASEDLFRATADRAGV